MKSIQALREQRHALAKEIHDLVEKNPGEKWNADLNAQYDTKMSELDVLDAEIKRNQGILDRINIEDTTNIIADAADRLAVDKKNPALALYAKWLRGGDNALSQDEWKIVNTMSTGTGSEGGYTVQTEVARTIMDALKQTGGMRAVATVIQTEQGNPLSYPTSDGTTEEGEIIAENTTAGSDVDPSFGTVGISVYKFSSKPVACPIELIQDSAVDIDSFIANRLNTRIARITNKKFTIGTGSSEPRGVVAAAVSGKVGTTGQTTSVIVDDLIDLIHSVDPAYRALGRCRFMMHDNTFRAIRKLKDSQGRPIFLPGYDGLAGPMADTILGYPVAINQDIATMAANAKSILFGDFSYYIIRDVMAATLFRFTDSAYTKKGQVGFLQWSRHGGNFVDVGGAVKYYQNSAT